MPEVSDIERMTSRKFSGSWNGSARIDSPNSIAKSAQLALVDLPQLGEAHAAEAGEQLGHRPLELGRVGRRQQDADTADAVDQPLAVARGDREHELLQAAAQSVGHLAHHAEVDEGEPPGATAGDAASVTLEPATRHPHRSTGVTKMLPGCGSAWKKPSRKSWSNMTVANCLRDRLRVDARRHAGPRGR